MQTVNHKADWGSKMAPHRHPRCTGFAVAVLFALTACFIPARAEAGGILYQFDNVFSGSNGFSDSPPWLDATFQDASNGVLLTIANSNLASGEFVSGVYFNFDPADTVTNLNFTFQSAIGTFGAASVSTGENAFKADGDGSYDILLGFSTMDGRKFTGGDSVTYLIGGEGGLTASDFSFTSANGSSALYAAAHVQGFAGGQSAWIDPQAGPIQVPEPAGVGFFLLGSVIAARYRRSAMAGFLRRVRPQKGD
ncbi:MAG: hypothetical protein KGR98_10760 [Verrucomicrobia bacterium]|nr:hypothetical protein [Verrucomicrobiota bacterium]MDE3099840.1 hypothetical protein [Verrucomicrobiota bacterium]